MDVSAGTCETRQNDLGTFAELLDKLYEQHLQELRAVQEENAQLRSKVKTLEASRRPTEDMEDVGLSKTPHSVSDENLSTVEVDFADWRGPSIGSAERMQQALQVARTQDMGSLRRASEDSDMVVPQRSLVQKMSGMVPSIGQKEEVRLFNEPVQTMARSRVLAFVEDMIQRPLFEAFFGALILLNALVMAAEAQYKGLLLGTELGHASAEDIDAATLWPGAIVVFNAFGWFFGLAFLGEVLLKIIGLRSRFPCAAWNWIDSAIVILWLVGEFGATLSVDPNLMRLARLARLLRLLRLVQTIQGFDSLYLITTSIASSVSILAWTSVMFFLCQMALALFLSGLLTETYFRDAEEPLENMQTVYTYFGTFSRALFSMFEITLGNWPPVSRILSENVSEWFLLFGVAHKLTLGFAFVGVVNGVFMQETFKVASNDDKVMVRQKQRMVDTHAKKMRWFFNKADRDKSNDLDLVEFKEMVSDPTVSMWLASMELDEKDYDLLFSLIDDGDGSLTLRELIKGVAKLRGAARSIDVVRVLREVEGIRTMLEAAGFAAAHRRTIS